MSRFLSLPLAFLLIACTQPKGTDSADTGLHHDSGDTETDSDTGHDTSDTSDTDHDTNSDTSSDCPAVSESTTTLLVTDIDETLTTLDSEFLTQIFDPTHDPEMRPDANTLMQAYHDLGYRIVYLTARGEYLYLVDGTSARDATTAWLTAHGFPFDPADVYLADAVYELDPAGFKTGVVEGLQTEGYSVEWAYGNATTDIEAYQNAALADDHTFLVGSLSDTAGTYGVNPIADADAYTNHQASFMSSVPCGG